MSGSSVGDNETTKSIAEHRENRMKRKPGEVSRGQIMCGLESPNGRASFRKEESHVFLGGRAQTSRSPNDGSSLDQRHLEITTKLVDKNFLISKYNSNNHFPEHHMAV